MSHSPNASGTRHRHLSAVLLGRDHSAPGAPVPCNRVMTIPFSALAAGAVVDTLTNGRAIHHPHGFGFQLLGQFYGDGYFFAVSRRGQAVVLTASTETKKHRAHNSEQAEKPDFVLSRVDRLNHRFSRNKLLGRQWR